MDFSTKSNRYIAALAVQKGSSEILVKGLHSLFESTAKNDYRDIISGLILYYDAAKRIGLEVDDFFLEFGKDNKEYFQQINDFVSRPDQDKTLKAHGFKISDSTLFNYEYDL